MLYIFPNVATQLGAEDEALRARAVALLGRLFAATHAEYGLEYPRIFREFLGRFKDKESAIRSQLVGIGAAIMQRKPRLAEQIVPHLQARLQDPVRLCVLVSVHACMRSLQHRTDPLHPTPPQHTHTRQEWEIRAKTVKEACQVALKHLELVPPALVREVGERCVRCDAWRLPAPCLPSSPFQSLTSSPFSSSTQPTA